MGGRDEPALMRPFSIIMVLVKNWPLRFRTFQVVGVGFLGLGAHLLYESLERKQKAGAGRSALVLRAILRFIFVAG